VKDSWVGFFERNFPEGIRVIPEKDSPEVLATYNVIDLFGLNPVLSLTWYPYKGIELHVDSIEETGDGGWRVTSREGNYIFRSLSDRDKTRLQAEIDFLTGGEK
jgi:hypothetical protein